MKRLFAAILTFSFLLLLYGAAEAESLASLAKKEKERQENSQKENGPSITADNSTLEKLDKQKTPLNIVSKPEYLDNFEKKILSDIKKKSKREEVFRHRILGAEKALIDAEKNLEELILQKGSMQNKIKRLPENYKDLSRSDALSAHSENIENAEKRRSNAENQLKTILKDAREAGIEPGVIREARQAAKN